MRKHSVYDYDPLIRFMGFAGYGMACSPVRIVFWCLVLRTGPTTSTPQFYDVCRNASPSAYPISNNARKYLRLYVLHPFAGLKTLDAYMHLQMLKDTQLAEGFFIRKLSEETDGLSGSDLKELCRNAAMRPMREFIREADDDHEMLSRSQEEVRRAFLVVRVRAKRR